MDYGTTTRDRLEAAERQIHAARAAREQELRNEDRAQRERLEKQSPSGSRRGLVDLLNGQSDQRTARELPGVLVLEGIRRMQEVGRKSPEAHNAAHAEYELKKLAESFNRLARSTAVPVQGTRESYGEARLNPERPVAPRGSYDFRPGEPGNNLGSRFQWSDEFAPPQGVDRVRDADGSMDASVRTRVALFEGQGVSNALNSLSIEDLKHILSMRIRGRFF